MNAAETLCSFKNCDSISLLGDLFEFLYIIQNDIQLLGKKFSLPDAQDQIPPVVGLVAGRIALVD